MSKQILIVEDDSVTTSLIRQKFIREGYTVFAAENGEEGLKSLERNQVDLIVTDVEMPVMDGVDFYANLKKNKKTKNIPIIVLTDSDAFKKSFKNLGVEGFVEKPIDIDKLFKEVKKILNPPKKSGDERTKISIVGSDELTLKEMEKLLTDHGFFVATFTDEIEFIANVLTIKPQILFIDVLMHDILSGEIIKALKCFNFLHNSKLLIYTHFAPEELGDVDMVEHLKQSKDACMAAGATQYIGRFSNTTFIGSIYEFIREKDKP